MPIAAANDGDRRAHPAEGGQRHDEPVERAGEIDEPGQQSEGEAAAGALTAVGQRHQQRRERDPPKRGMAEFRKAQREKSAGQEREGEIQQFAYRDRT